MDCIKVRVIKDSIYHSRLTTLEVTYPKYIHAEVMTHRVFSRNFQSSRAIPVDKLIQQVRESTWYPIFMKNKPGMAALERLSDIDLEAAKNIWNLSKKEACDNADRFGFINCHKQIANRVLEPYSTITGLITSTEWDNFFSLRIHPAAQQEIQILAKRMKEALDSSEPTPLDLANWHLPFIGEDEEDLPLDLRLKISTARVARVSYLNHDGVRDVDKDVNLHDTLKSERHMSPFEHIATPSVSKGFSNNFRGWVQYRKYVESGTY